MPDKKSLQVVADQLSADPSLDLENEDFIDQEVELVVCENHRKPGEPIFVLPCGKVGFPSYDSQPIAIGQKISGLIVFEHDSYFLIEVRNIIEESPKK